MRLSPVKIAGRPYHLPPQAVGIIAPIVLPANTWTYSLGTEQMSAKVF
jgi:hypothetical protein